MYYQRLSDEEILSGFREGDAEIIRSGTLPRYYQYRGSLPFYGYCQVGYNIFDQRYQLREKENLDFMSLAHQYALYLMEHDWKPLEDHSPNVSLKTWLINGFRYVVLDALKWYRKEYGSITFEDYLMSFDVTSDLRLQFNRMVEDVCDHAPLDRQERLIIDMLLLQGQSYAIPTMQGGVETIRPYVDEFIAFAKENKNLTFLVTRIGCGIAGFTDEEIAPLFEKAHDVENIVLPPGW